MKKKILLPLSLLLLYACGTEPEPELAAPSLAPVIAFAQERYETSPDVPITISGAISSERELTEVKYSLLSDSSETHLQINYPGNERYTFAQTVTPTVQTTGFKVTAKNKGGAVSEGTVAIIVTDPGVIVEPVQPPAATLTVRDVGETSAVVAWTPADAAYTSLLLECPGLPAATYAVDGLSDAIAGKRLEGLAAGTSYTVALRYLMAGALYTAGSATFTTTDPYTPPTVGAVALDKLYGWATADGGTTGGGTAADPLTPASGAAVHHFDDGLKFADWLLAREKAKSTAPAVVWLSGTFTKEQGTRKSASSPWYDIKRTHNITIIGTDNFRMQHIGFFLNEASNIIIRNVYIVMPKADNGADGVSIQESHNVWIDHCSFESVNQTKDYEDGSCDITHETYHVTVSWCHYIKAQKSSLVGHSNNASADVQITATFHHNYFDLSNSRHPRVRFGRVHVYNNFYKQVSTYGVGSAYGAKVLVEANYFDGVHLPTDICTYPAKSSGSNLEGSVAGYLYATNDNVYVNKPSNASSPYPFTNVEYKSYNGEKLPSPLTYNDFKPAYSYTVDDAAQLATIVPNGAGVGKLGYQTAPIAVDNGGITGGGGEGGGGTPIANGWSYTDIASSAGSYTLNGGTITVTGKGKFASEETIYAYVYRVLTGDFVLTAQLHDYTRIATSNPNQARGALLLTADISAGRPYVSCGKAGDDKFYRTLTGNSRTELTAPNGSGDVYLKLERAGAVFHASYSLDGGLTYGSATTSTDESFPSTLYVGIAVNSGDNGNGKTASASVSNVKVNGEPVDFF